MDGNVDTNSAETQKCNADVSHTNEVPLANGNSTTPVEKENSATSTTPAEKINSTTSTTPAKKVNSTTSTSAEKENSTTSNMPAENGKSSTPVENGQATLPVSEIKKEPETEPDPPIVSIKTEPDIDSILSNQTAESLPDNHLNASQSEVSFATNTKSSPTPTKTSKKKVKKAQGDGGTPHTPRDPLLKPGKTF